MKRNPATRRSSWSGRLRGDKGGWTPGPWYVIPDEFLRDDTLAITTDLGNAGEWIASVRPITREDGSQPGTESDIARQQANARLIAAAPTLYKALSGLWHEVLRDMDRGLDKPQALVDEVRDALSLALRGEADEQKEQRA